MHSNDDRMARVQSLFVAALQQPAEHRDRWLRDTDVGSETVVDEVRALVNYCDRSNDPLEEGAQVSVAINSFFKNCQLFEAGEQIGKFEIKRLLGVGGFGVVYLCRDPVLERDVAVKIPHAAAHSRSADFDRQIEEARQVAALDCPGVVPVFEGDRTEDGRPFFVMKYIRGTSLEDRLRTDRPNPIESAALLARVAEILATVHAQGIVHRDLKPSNILLDEDGRPFVADFGLATTESQSAVDSGRLAGTPAYMAPEQFRSNVGVDARTDVWALGVILYELLTGRRPFRGDSLAGLHAAVASKTPVEFDQFKRQVPSGLVRICKKCLQKSPDDRFRSATAVADALWQQCPRRMRPLGKRRRFAAMVIGVVLAAGALAVGGSLLLVNRTQSQLSGARQQTMEHRTQLRQARYTSDMVSAYHAWDKRRLENLHAILESHRPQPGEIDYRGFEWHLLNSVSKQPEPTLLVGHQGAVNEMALFPDRRRVASVGEDGTLRIWDIPAKRLIATIDLGEALENIDLATGGLHSVAVSPNGRYVVAGADVVGICDLEQDDKVRELFRADYNVDSLAFSADGERIAAGTRYEDISLLSLDGELLARVPCGSRAESLAYLPDRNLWLVPNAVKHLSVDDPRAFLQLWDDRFEQVVREIDTTNELGYSYLKFARVSPCRRYVVAASSETASLHVLALDSGQVLGTIEGFRDKISDLDLSPDATALAAAHFDGNICYQSFVVDDHGKVSIDTDMQTLFAHEGGANGIRFLNTDTLLTCGADGLKVWDPRQFANKVEIHLDAGGLSHPEYSADGQRLIVGSVDAGVWFIDGNTCEVLGSHPHPSLVATALSPSGKKIAMVCREDRTATIGDSGGRELVSMAHHISITHSDGLKDVDFSPDGRTVATIGHFLRLTNVETGETWHDRLLPGMARVVTFSHRGDWLAYGGEFQRVCVWHLARDQPSREMECNSHTNCIAVSHDDGLLASGHSDTIIRLWNVSTGQLEAELVGHEYKVLSVSFSPDGRSLLSADGETLRIWSLGEHRLLGTIHRRSGLVSATLSPDGRRLVACINESNPSKPNLVIWTVDDGVR